MTFLVQREDDLSINRIAKAINAQNTRKVEQVKSMLNYIETPVCRSKQLLAYFEEKQEEPCGICDICREKLKSGNSRNDQDLQTQIIKTLAEGPASSRTLIETLTVEDEAALLKTLKRLLMNKKISLTPSNLYKLL